MRREEKPRRRMIGKGLLSGFSFALAALLMLSTASATVVEYAYQYDGAGRLVRATGNGKVISYSYDGAGNGIRLTVSGYGKGDLSFGGPVTLREAVLLLQAAAGMKPDLSSLNVLAEISGDGKLGLEETLFILQTIGEMR